MQHFPNLPPIDWVRRINRSWIVHNSLNDQAESWINYLAAHDPARLERSCRIARAMCDLRGPLDDPKPWFYAGLFHLATTDEGQRFLALHRVTKATVPAMALDNSVNLWLERITPETREVLNRLNPALAEAARIADTPERTTIQ